ncbi:MAG TPA: ATP-binding protein [Solirubrobacteraceae bacterium]|jgi:two-component system sensor histidine kinase MprB|nr:ATP-binding protein [Solirubrobacteraceae bacterium]
MMALRHRLTILTAGAVGITVVLISIVAYVALRSELRGQVDDALAAQFQQVRATRNLGAGQSFPLPPARAGGPYGPAQLIDYAGDVLIPARGDLPVPIDASDRAVAAGRQGTLLRDIHAAGVHLRLLTVPIGGGEAVQLARSLGNVDATLSRLRLLLLTLCAGGTLLAALCGRLFARRVIQPVTDLTAAAEHITQTEDLGRRIEVPGDDEVGRMAARFNTMLDTLEGSRRALDDSVHAQRQLVADASHELRTPVTSLRTNIEVLLAGGELPDDDRRRLLEDVRAETEELSALITDVIELARGDEPLSGVEEVQLDALVAEAVARAQRRRPNVTFATGLAPTVVEGLPDRLGRAVDNLLDNAGKYSPGGTVVEVLLAGGELSVRDHGPGIPAADRPHVFDRFYRGATARGRPGSGLGLAIVRQVAETHGGTVAVYEGAGGGSRFVLRLPVLGAGVDAAGVEQSVTQPPKPAASRASASDARRDPPVTGSGTSEPGSAAPKSPQHEPDSSAPGSRAPEPDEQLDAPATQPLGPAARRGGGPQNGRPDASEPAREPSAS